jgi:hypothetical protein
VREMQLLSDAGTDDVSIDGIDGDGTSNWSLVDEASINTDFIS